MKKTDQNYHMFTKIKGVYPAALTMFDQNGKLDELGTWHHVDWLIRQGVHGIVAAGTSGEFIALETHERKYVIEIILDAAKDRVPVIASTGFYSTHSTIDFTQWVEDKGALGALVILPYFLKPNRASVLQHYKLIAKETKIPIMVYNNPANTACDMMASSDMAKLAHEGIVHGVKSTMATTVPIIDLKNACPPEFRVFYGSFMAPLQGLLAGADGWISGFINLVPKEAVDLFNACEASDISHARNIWKRLAILVNLYFEPKHQPAADLPLWRAGLDLLGHNGGYSRPPFFPITSDQLNDLKEAMSLAELLSLSKGNDS